MARLKLGRPVRDDHVSLPLLASHRIAAGLSQEDLAARVRSYAGAPRVTRSAIAQWETGRRRAPSSIVPYLSRALRQKVL